MMVRKMAGYSTLISQQRLGNVLSETLRRSQQISVYHFTSSNVIVSWAVTVIGTAPRHHTHVHPSSIASAIQTQTHEAQNRRFNKNCHSCTQAGAEYCAPDLTCWLALFGRLEAPLCVLLI